MTVADTLASSYLTRTAREAGAAAEQASMRKMEKYNILADNYHFVPVALETLGPLCAEASTFIADLGHRLSTISGDQRETHFLHQRLFLQVQRFNAVAFRSTFTSPDPATLENSQANGGFNNL